MIKINKKKFLVPVVFGVLMMAMIIPVGASNLMDARLSASFHYVPILSDTATAYTFYGTNTYCNTAAA